MSPDSRMQTRTSELAGESIGRLLIRYSAPSIIAMLVNSTYNVVDTIFVGQGVGTTALAALAVAFPIQMFILAIAQVVGIGSASIISRSLGAGDRRRAERTAGGSFAAVTALSIVLTVVGLVFLEPILRLFGATDAVLPYAAEYLSVILLGSFFFAFDVSSNNVARAEGAAKVAMTSMIIGALTNIILDPIFIFGLGMGIRGAAIATVIANACAFVYLCGYFLSGRSVLRIRLEDLAPDWRNLPEVVSIGGSSFTRVVAGSLQAIVLNNSIAHYGSDTHLAVLGVMNRVMLFTLMPLFGLVHGLQPIVGFNYGARNMGRVKEALTKAGSWASVLCVVAFIVLMAAPRHVLLLFNRDPVLLDEGVPMLRIIVIFFPFVGFQIIGSSLFQAIGKAGPALFLSMSRQILFLIPLILTLPLAFRLTGIWIAFPVADALSTLVTALWVIREVRLLDRMTALHGAPPD